MGTSPKAVMSFSSSFMLIPGSGVSLSPSVRRLRQSGLSGSSRHRDGIDLNEDLFLNESALSLPGLVPL